MKAAEALSASELSDAQSEHYALDDKLRRHIGKLTLAQKRDVVNKVGTMVDKINNTGEDQ